MIKPPDTKVLDSHEVTIIVTYGGRIYVQGPHRNVLTGESSTIRDLQKILDSSVAYMLPKIVRDITYDIGRGVHK